VSLSEAFHTIQPSIVALGARFIPAGTRPTFPPILGTGFVVGSDGIVATNRHVVRALEELPTMDGVDETPALALVFTAPEKIEDAYGVIALPVAVLQCAAPAIRPPAAKNYYGPELPDIAFVQIAMAGLPEVRLAAEPWSLNVGTAVATAGFPFGEDPLVANGVVSQVTPMLRQGIVSSLQPFPCPQPHGFTIDSMSQGGQSGSPIFRISDAAVVGMLYAGYDGTNITFAVTAFFISEALRTLRERGIFPSRKLPTLEEERKTRNLRKGVFWRAV
jgi:S1-C subfamily serine protease